MGSKRSEEQGDHRLQKRRLSSGSQQSERLEQASKARKFTHVPSPTSDQLPRAPKRKSLHDNDCIFYEEPPSKKLELASSSASSRVGTGSDDQYGAEIHWNEYFGDWPPKVIEQKMTTQEPRAMKRPSTRSRSSSYSQRVRDGESPAAWTRAHEEKMEEAGLVMDPDRTQAAITNECQQLCKRLLEAEYTLPDESAYQQDRVKEVLQRARWRNEARVVRDVMPIVVPSPELLHIDGHAELDNVCEAMTAEWTQCETLYGPQPKPDFVAGITPATFTEEEKQKLKMLNTSACTNLFPENMYFPFLVCEAKNRDCAIQKAERQAMHAASIAIRAIVELFRKVSATAEVHQKVLAFSVVLNPEQATIFTHFAKIDGQKTIFFRQELCFLRFRDALQSTAWAKPYKIIRAIYEHFVPQHVDRIRGVLSRMTGPLLLSSSTRLGIDDDSRESAPEQSVSQEDGVFKKPALPTANRLQKENELLRTQYMELIQHNRDTREQMEKQLVQQKEESEKQKEEARELKIMLAEMRDLLKAKAT